MSDHAINTPHTTTPLPLTTITLGAGCFWCIEAAFAAIRGVESVVSGYMGGPAQLANYQAICQGDSGHTEVVQLQYQSDVISTAQLLELFFFLHDPTTLNRQGNDVGSQYRSVIYVHSPEQQEHAVASLAAAQSLWADPIVTAIEPASVFYPAEAYHQRFVANNPNQPYCRALVLPKLAKFKQAYASLLK